MDIAFYRTFLRDLIKEAIANSDGTASGIHEYLTTRNYSGLLVRKKTEKQKALSEAMRVFSEHRHWPLEIIISHLGLEPDEVMKAS